MPSTRSRCGPFGMCGQPFHSGFDIAQVAPHGGASAAINGAARCTRHVEGSTVNPGTPLNVLQASKSELLELLETRWCVRLGERVVECTIHRTDVGFAVVARCGPVELLRVVYTESMIDAQAAADEWRDSLVLSGFADVG
jgi:hypothetical protein